MPSRSMLHVEGLFDPTTCTMSYIVLDRGTMQCALVDSVLDFDPGSGRISHASAERLAARVRALGASVQWILETHVHADHLSAARHLQQALGGRIGTSRHITAVQAVFGSVFNAGHEFACDGRQFDHLFADGEHFHIGCLQARALHTPGHTPACMTYLVCDAGDRAAFVGDTLSMPDSGTARCDFPGGDARTLFRSINRLLSLPPDTQLYMGHDDQPDGRDLQYASTVAEARERNVHVRNGISEEQFVALRHAQDAMLAPPGLILPAVQVNMRAGQLPEPESNGTRYIKIPLSVA